MHLHDLQDGNRLCGALLALAPCREHALRLHMQGNRSIIVEAWVRSSALGLAAAAAHRRHRRRRCIISADSKEQVTQTMQHGTCCGSQEIHVQKVEQHAPWGACQAVVGSWQWLVVICLPDSG